jgi:hypothetical protein
VKLERRQGYWLLVGGPVPPGMAAITLGRLISVRARSAGDEQLLRHELVHVRQWRQLGVLRFSARYVGAYVRGRLAGRSHLDSYRQIPLEVEAVRESRLGT